MLNIYATLNIKREYLIRCINDELDRYNIPLTLSDEPDSKICWNIYDCYDRRVFNPNKRFLVSDTDYLDCFNYYVIVEYVEGTSTFGNKKLWFILRRRNYYPQSPYFEEYKGKYCWNSLDITLEEMIMMVLSLDKIVDDGYHAEYNEYMEERKKEEEFELYGSNRSLNSEESEDFNSIMNDFDAWGNID